MVFLRFILLISFLFGCASTKYQSKRNKIIAINFIVRLPLVQSDGQLLYLDDTTSIYYYNDLIVYQLPYIFESSRTIIHVKTDSVSEEKILTETRYNYFVYRKGKHLGLCYSSIEQLDSNKRLSADSIIALKAPSYNLQNIIISPNYTLIEKLHLNNGNVFIEKYIPKQKPDESYNDTSLLYYSIAMKPISFSLSPFLDSVRNAKLYKLQLAFNEAYSHTYSMKMPKRDIIYEIELLRDPKLNDFKALLERFEKDEKFLL